MALRVLYGIVGLGNEGRNNEETCCGRVYIMSCPFGFVDMCSRNMFNRRGDTCLTALKTCCKILFEDFKAGFETDNGTYSGTIGRFAEYEAVEEAVGEGIKINKVVKVPLKGGNYLSVDFCLA